MERRQFLGGLAAIGGKLLMKNHAIFEPPALNQQQIERSTFSTLHEFEASIAEEKLFFRQKVLENNLYGNTRSHVDKLTHAQAVEDLTCISQCIKLQR